MKCEGSGRSILKICMIYVDIQGQVAVHICSFDGIGRADVEVRVGKLKNGNAAGKDEITGEMIKGGGGRVVD